MNLEWSLSPRQAEFWSLCEGGKRVCAFVGGIRAGKTWLGVRRLIVEVVRRKGLSWVVVPTYTMMGPVRRTFEEALPEEAIADKKETPFPYYRFKREWGGGEIEFRSAEDPDRLKGASLQCVLFDEAAQAKDEVLVEGGRVTRRCAAWDALLGRVLDTQGSVLVTTTPKGKNWLYEAFLLRPGHDYGIVFARTDENPKLDARDIQDLRKQYSGTYGRQELEAEFVSGEGVFFGEWERSQHTCRPFDLPAGWRFYGALDDGYTAPYSFGLYAHDPEGTLYRVAERYGPGYVTAVKAQQIAECIGSRKVHTIVCDPSMWAKKSDSGESTAEVLQRELRKLVGKTCPPLVKGSNSRVEGWKRAREWLAPVESLDGTSRSRFKAFDTCTHFLRTVPALIQDKHNVEDVETHGEDHCADEWRYLLMNRPRPTVASQSQPEPNTGAALMQQTLKGRRHSKYIGGTDAPVRPSVSTVWTRG